MLEFTRKIAIEAGKIAIAGGKSLTSSEIYVKNTPTDMVTAIDREVEAYLTGEIRKRFPEHGIFGEENGETAGSGEYRWVIDPIDGTTNFIHGIPYYSISIALQKLGKTIIGVVYSPRLNELYAAEAGKGAYLNGQAIHVSNSKSLEQSVLATGYACMRARLRPDNLDILPSIARLLQGIRSNGSAALDLCHVATGPLDGYWEFNLNLYDIAAGALIVQEAGGCVTDSAGQDQWPKMGILATNKIIHAAMLKEFQRQKDNLPIQHLKP